MQVGAQGEEGGKRLKPWAIKHEKCPLLITRSKVCKKHTFVTDLYKETLTEAQESIKTVYLGVTGVTALEGPEDVGRESS